ncbi:MAG TPA: GNAT family N-acetyltransferase [Candidatus Thermoplasmatota archaeon]|nr:GNAT family N-acetyltransferase [Candidatus Thermoplasmatota archaeon]
MIRDATLADLDAALELERACYPPHQAYARAEYRYALGVAKAVNLALVEDGRMTGFAGAFRHATRRVGHVYTVNVHPSQRGRGLGVRLMEALHDRLRATGMRRMVLEVNVENDPAMRLYERCGYRRAGLLKGYYSQYRVNDAWRYERDL